MRRTIRCEHGFAKGLCRVEGCPHEERRGASQRRAKPTTCKGCGGEASVKVWKSGWLCQGCADLREARGRREMVHQYRGLYLLTALMLGCGGVDVPNIPTPGTCGFWEELTIIWPDDVREEPGTCVWVYSNSSDVVFKPPDDCPSEGDPTCVIVLPGEELEAWGELSRPESLALSIRFDLGADGSCPVTCENEFGCAPNEDVPEICVPCTADDPCP